MVFHEELYPKRQKMGAQSSSLSPSGIRVILSGNQVGTVALIKLWFLQWKVHCVPLAGFEWHFFQNGKVRISFHPEKPSGTTSKPIQGLRASQLSEVRKPRGLSRVALMASKCNNYLAKVQIL